MRLLFFCTDAKRADTRPVRMVTESVALKHSNCDWDNCAGTRGAATSQRHAHMQEHTNELLQYWTSPARCNWTKCRSRRRFKTRYLFKTHLVNIHAEPIICKFPKCSHKQPFGTRSYLDRHIGSVHSDQRDFVCPVDDCHQDVTVFAQRDKWLKHIKQYHALAKCVITHCETEIIDLEGQKDMHMKLFNGQYECAVGSCRTSISRFTRNALVPHFRGSRNMRGILFGPEGAALPLIFESQHFPVYLWGVNFDKKGHDCSDCGPKPKIRKHGLEVYQWNERTKEIRRV